MPSHPRNMPEQEHSIKARSHELFVDDTPLPEGTSRPFAAYLRETPARPLSLAVKALFWVLGLIVAVLFLLALWRVAHRHHARPRSSTASPFTKAAMAEDGVRRPLLFRNGGPHIAPV